MRKIEEILKNERIWGYDPTSQFYFAWVKLPDCGTCSVVWNDYEGGMEHVSVSPKKQFRIPSWDDMCALKDIFFADEEEVYQIHPKKSEYVNMVGNCLHLWKPKDRELNDLKRLDFLQRWKDDVVESLAKYDADTVDEVYRKGIQEGALGMEE